MWRRAVAKQAGGVHWALPGGQSQFRAALELEPKSDRIQTRRWHTQKHKFSMRRLTVGQLAEAGISVRASSAVRPQARDRPKSPGPRAVEKPRFEAAHDGWSKSRHRSHHRPAKRAFADRDRMGRRAFLRGPSDNRRRLSGETARAEVAGA